MAYIEPTEANPRSRRPLQPNHIGINPHEIIGKTLKRARRSSKHPSATLEFTDNTVLQILVDGYDPVHRGIPKELDMDPFINAICTNASPVNLTVTGCTLITLSDKAYERRNGHDESDELRWDRRHRAVAFKFAGDDLTWHSVSAMMEECDPGTGSCIFRNYIDVYLKLHTNRHFEENGNPVLEADRSETFLSRLILCIELICIRHLSTRLIFVFGNACILTSGCSCRILHCTRIPAICSCTYLGQIEGRSSRALALNITEISIRRDKTPI